VYASFDDGESWQSLRINMPATAIRDLVIKDDDLVVGTHGRSFWILDDITPLRQITPASLQEAAVFFRPQEAWRFRWNKNTDTPLPPDEPAGQNPPDGAIVHYFLKAAAAQPVVLEVLDAAGTVVRRYRSDDVPEPPVEGRNIPDYWIRPPQVLSAQPGLHRFVWDLHHAPPAAASFSYPIAAVAFDTPREPRGPWAVPGTYTVRITVDGRTLTQPLRIKLDPRVKTSPEDLRAQLERSLDVAREMARTRDALAQAKGERAATLAALSARLLSLYEVLQEADVAPTPAALETAEILRGQVTKALMP
jgi:nucleotide-binding universal stress UspA family protein